MTFYQLLEVSPEATASDIRRAYRRLVLLTHPDRTPDPAAHQRYLAINEAYDTLSHPARRQAYDARLASPVSYGPLPAPRRQPARWRPRTPEEARLGVHAHIYLRYTALARRVNVALAVLCLVLAFDYFIPLHYPAEDIRQAEYYEQHGRNGVIMNTYYVYETPHTSARIPDFYPEGTVLFLKITPLFRQVLAFRRATDPPEATIDNREHTIYGTIGWLFGVVGIVAVVGAWPGRVARRQVECAVMAVVLLLILIWSSGRI